MDWHLSLNIVILLVSAAISLPISIYAWKHRDVPGAAPFAYVTLAGFVCTAAYALQLSSTDLDINLFWSNIQYLGYATVPVGFCLLALQYAGMEHLINRRRLLLLLVIPAATIILVWTNQHHGLVRASYYLDTTAPDAVLRKSYGIWFWVHTIYTYVLITIAVFLLFYSYLHVPFQYKRQPLALLLGISIIFLGNILYVVVIKDQPDIDLTLLLYTPAGLISAWGLFRYQLFDLSPIARDRVVENMDDGMLVVDSQNRIVDINPAAKRLFGPRAEGMLGQSVEALFQHSPELIQLIQDRMGRQTELVVEKDGEQRFFNVRKSPLKDTKDHMVGDLIIFHDISDQKKVESELRRLSSTDALTNLANRREFFQRLHSEIDRARRYKLDLSLVIIDFDQFKLINDTLGHQAGDDALQQVAASIRQSTRQADLAARYGGDEFVILLPQTGISGARSLTLRLFAHALKIRVSDDIHLSFSAGIAKLDDDDDPQGKTFVARADRALYQAKQTKQRYVIAGPAHSHQLN